MHKFTELRATSVSDTHLYQFTTAFGTT